MLADPRAESKRWKSVVPAKAGTQCRAHRKSPDSRFRGDDRQAHPPYFLISARASSTSA